MSRYVHERLRSISVLQSKIREQANKAIVYDEALSRQKKAFQQLEYVALMPRAYRASLDEVARRRRYRKAVINFCARTSENLLKTREEELARRQSYVIDESVNL